MSSFQIYVHQIENTAPKIPKYSLRDRVQKRQSKLEKTKSQLYQQEDRKQGQSRLVHEKDEGRKDLSMLASTFTEDNSFNCISNVQTVLEFNRATSVNILKSEENVQLSPDSESMLKIASRPSLVHKLGNSGIQFSNILRESIRLDDSVPSKENRVEEDFRLRSSLIIETQSESRISQVKKHPKSKFSLRKSNPLVSTRSQFRVCLSYADIKYPLRLLKNEELSQMFENRQSLQKRQNESKIAKFFCNQLIKFHKQGCSCEPKCVWINRWLNRAQYQEIKSTQIYIPEKQWEATLNQIEKDLPRTQINNQAFKLQSYLQMLREVLVNYSRIDWQVGYVQGMNIVASVIVYHSSNSYQALKVFELLMRQMNLRQVYESDLTFGFHIASALGTELKRLSFDLHSHLTSQGLDLKIFATSWYLSLLGSFVPLEWMHAVVQKYMRRGWSGINEVILSLFLLLKEELLQRYEQELMQFLSSKSLQQRSQLIDWYDLIIRSDNILLPAFQF